ncbi:hypothetical protein P152DRAFT_450537 [Eremomyces bilateralis CBS 781.70]|uniref:Uncharacterized protein n=1 Tax=Eremomyces bilateralis CBS 781.70 TaxID=1392243 RepID=A0A6G1FYT9_9PEZI|nr:uncharacterized protein P152DRAFT_450537 [Eremomyces bilateralis CBS 781.70]KAF1810938.1 hypothetical protein P152DRAFT_450537 [Eremomyces bilateralis CBS 781.70]
MRPTWYSIDLPHPENIRERFGEGGIPMCHQEVTDLANHERLITGRLSIGGPTSVAMSCYGRYQKYLVDINDPDQPPEVGYISLIRTREHATDNTNQTRPKRRNRRDKHHTPSSQAAQAEPEEDHKNPMAEMDPQVMADNLKNPAAKLARVIERIDNEEAAKASGEASKDSAEVLNSAEILKDLGAVVDKQAMPDNVKNPAAELAPVIERIDSKEAAKSSTDAPKGSGEAPKDIGMPGVQGGADKVQLPTINEEGIMTGKENETPN